jgi:small subunit ribosomal protein S18
MAKSKKRKQQSRRREKVDSKRRKRIVYTFAEDDYVDYKDVPLLRKFMSDRGKIRARRVTGLSAKRQREVARAIKNAREMALLPYVSTKTPSKTGGRQRR